MPKSLALFCRWLQHTLQLTPSDIMVRRLRRQGVDLSSMHGLEMFCGDGNEGTARLIPYFRDFEVWDIDPEVCARLPHVVVRAVDSFQQLRETNQTYDFVSADVYPWLVAGHYDNFELFPDVFRILAPTGYLQVNLITDWNLPKYAGAEAFSDECRRRRAEFFRCDDPTRLTSEQIVGRYRELAEESGHRLEWYLTQDRYPFYRIRRHSKKWRLQLLVMKFVQTDGDQQAGREIAQIEGEALPCTPHGKVRPVSSKGTGDDCFEGSHHTVSELSSGQHT